MPVDLNKVLLKISGEILSGDEDNTFDNNVLLKIARDIKSIHEIGIKVAIVIGGGNIIRGINHKDLNLSKNDADNSWFENKFIFFIFNFRNRRRVFL